MRRTSGRRPRNSDPPPGAPVLAEGLEARVVLSTSAGSAVVREAPAGEQTADVDPALTLAGEDNIWPTGPPLGGDAFLEHEPGYARADRLGDVFRRVEAGRRRPPRQPGADGVMGDDVRDRLAPNHGGVPRR